MGGRFAQDIDESLLGVLWPVQRSEQNRALQLGIDGVVLGGSTRQPILELCESRLLRQPGSPAAAAGRAGKDSRVLNWSGHDMRWFDLKGSRLGFSIAHYVPIRLRGYPKMLPIYRRPAGVAGCFPQRSRNIQKQISRAGDLELRSPASFRLPGIAHGRSLLATKRNS
jgi:hypothetical protein